MGLTTLLLSGGAVPGIAATSSASRGVCSLPGVARGNGGGLLRVGGPAGIFSLGNSLYQSNALRACVPMAAVAAAATAAPPVVRSSLIEPDGGALVDLVVPPAEREARRAEAAALPRVRIGQIDLEWVDVIGNGWASPLRGFMREEEYLQSLHFNSLRLEDGSFVNMSLPIVLAIDDADKEAIGESSDVALAGPGGDLVAILRR